MKHIKFISALLTIALVISLTFSPAASAMDITDEYNENSKSEIELLIPEIDTEEYNNYILDTENYLNAHPELKGIYESFTDIERQYFWDSINNARVPFTSSNFDSDFNSDFEITPRFAPVVWFVAATCAKLVAKQLPKVTVKFTSHAVSRANERMITSKAVANTIVNGRKYMDKYTRARAVYDKEKNINVVFVGNSKEVATIYKPDAGEIASKFISSNWKW